ncbi:MAG: magnesium transporter CorA family protein [Rhodoferax sp.]|uniref:magnesium transporter CorA family protein n=1 Tax=Rhodoferax sp. TaxID=50421 RepID=UPI0026383A9D|nr:magnesium transporter CorA family protein [Rhodoferax sp.]MDD2881794.1 magnesium transporter CorA family protein [Rhodoferax sp.]
MRIFSIQGTSVSEAKADALPQSLDSVQLPAQGYLWLSCTRQEFEQHHLPIQTTLQRLCTLQLVDLHVSDLLNVQLPSRYDFTSQYDLLVFRRLATRSLDSDASTAQGLSTKPRGGPPILRRIDTSPVGFVVFDRVLLSVHPQDCSLRDSFAQRLLASGNHTAQATVDDTTGDNRSAGARGVASDPADLMLRIINHVVDGFLALRRDLTHQLDHWQAELLNPKTRFSNWGALLDARLALHQLDEICDDQRSAMQDWLEALKTWPESGSLSDQHARDMLQVRSRDVLEHIERVVHHVRRLEQNAETAVQMHFNAQSHRTNEIMRTLTVLTAIFLPLNLIAGIFGMNFEFIPLLHRSNGFWLAMMAMLSIAAGLVAFFWRKRYLERSAH